MKKLRGRKKKTEEAEPLEEEEERARERERRESYFLKKKNTKRLKGLSTIIVGCTSKTAGCT